MYTPAAFRVEDLAELAAFMAAHGFATLVTHDGIRSHATHVPVIHRKGEGPAEPDVLFLHLARGNPQSEHLVGGGEALVVFQGPHAYISPAWYATEPAVPTWNYTAVHAYGTASVVEDRERLRRWMDAMIDAYESSRENRWDGRMPEAFRDRMFEGILGFEIRIRRLEGKFKLSQNRSEADQAGVLRALESSMDPGDRALAAFMRGRGRTP